MIDTEGLVTLTGVGENRQTRLTDPALLYLRLGLRRLHVVYSSVWDWVSSLWKMEKRITIAIWRRTDRTHRIQDTIDSCTQQKTCRITAESNIRMTSIMKKSSHGLTDAKEMEVRAEIPR